MWFNFQRAALLGIAVGVFLGVLILIAGAIFR